MTRSKFSSGTWLERDMFESKAFWSLKATSTKMLIALLAKRQFKRITDRKGSKTRECINLDSLNLTYIELREKYGINTKRAIKGFDDLLAKGFIKVRHHGGGYKQDKNVYQLIEKWRLWRSGQVIAKRKKYIVKRGFCKPTHLRVVQK